MFLAGFMSDSKDRWKIPAVFCLSIYLTLSLKAFANFQGDQPFELSKMISLQKKFYLAHDWNHFFGAAQAYRKYWWKQAPYPPLLSLEALGLVQLCRYQEALQLLKSLDEWIQEQKDPPYSLLNRTSSLRSVISVFNELSAPSKKNFKNIQRSPRTHDSGSSEIYWPVDLDEAPPKWLPTDFIVKVTSQCE